MLSVLFLALTLAVVGIVIPLLGLLAHDTYGRSLEHYILSRNPQHPGDIDRLTIQFQREQERKFL